MKAQLVEDLYNTKNNIILDHHVAKNLDLSGTEAEIRSIIEAIANTMTSDEEVLMNNLHPYFWHRYCTRSF